MLSFLIQHTPAGHTDYPDHVRDREVCCVTWLSCVSRVFLSKCYVAVRDAPSCLPGFQSVLGNSRIPSVLCRSGEMRWDTHVLRRGGRKMGWLLSRHGLQSGNKRPSTLLLTMRSLDHFCPLLHGRCASSGNHHLRVAGYAVPTALIATPISAITAAVSDMDQ